MTSVQAEGPRQHSVNGTGEGGDAAPSLTSELGAGSVTSEANYAADFRTALLMADHGKLRSVQTSGGLLGASDAGGCPQKAAYTVKRTPPSDVVKTGKARVGTALHQVFLAQVKDLYPERIIEAELTATLPSGTQVLVHPDEIDPTEPSVTDLKTVSDLAYRRRVGVSDQHHMQRNLYALAAIQAKLVPEQGLTVRNAYLSMTDADEVWVQQEPFSMDWIVRADEWFAEVRYAVEHDEDARRDAPVYVCQSYCPFYTLCRPPLTDAMGELTSPALREAVLVGHEAREQRRYWALLEEEAKDKLVGVSGRAGDVQTISTWVNAKNGYWKQDYRRLT